MAAAVRVAAGYGVAAFGGFAVALELFVSDGRAAEGGGVGFEQTAGVVVGVHFARVFAYDGFGDFGIGRQGGLLQQGLPAGAQAVVVGDTGEVEPDGGGNGDQGEKQGGKGFFHGTLGKVREVRIIA